MLSLAEENYLKAIYKLTERQENTASTNALADELQTKPASVSDMMKKLAKKQYILYEKYRGVELTEEGRLQALLILRKHRLWETFLVEKLQFAWDEVHLIAEQLEHIHSSKLIDKLEEFLEYPEFDPHGDPIPNKDGVLPHRNVCSLLKTEKEVRYKLVGVRDSGTHFLRFMDKAGIRLGVEIQVIDFIEYDGSYEIRIDGERTLFISQSIADNMLMSAKEPNR